MTTSMDNPEMTPLEDESYQDEILDRLQSFWEDDSPVDPPPSDAQFLDNPEAAVVIAEPVSATSPTAPAETKPGSAEPTLSDEELHRRGLAHLQAGEWEPAVQYLSQLVERHPDNEYYRDLLEEARFKFQVDDSPPVQRRINLRSTRQRLILAATTLIFVGAMGAFSLFLYRTQIVPALQERTAIAYQQQLLEEGQQLVSAGQIDLAKARFEEVLILDPENTAAQRALAAIDERDRLEQNYAEAMALVEQEEWQKALNLLSEIRQKSPGFRDVPQQIERVQQLAAWDEIFQAAQEAYQAGDWSAAAQQLTALTQAAPDFKTDSVRLLLMDAYLQQAEEALAEAQQNPDQERTALNKAITFYRQALNALPGHPEATKRFTLAQAYLDGVQSYHNRSWEAASLHLATVYALDPAYMNGRAAQFLQETYVIIGNRYFQKNRPTLAAEKYRQALALSLVGDGRPLPEQASQQIALADEWFYNEQPQNAAMAYSSILAGMGFDTTFTGAVVANPFTHSGNQIYVVRPNDTLSSIAQRFNTTIDAIIAANSHLITNRNIIRPGWELVIPSTSS